MRTWRKTTTSRCSLKRLQLVLLAVCISVYPHMYHAYSCDLIICLHCGCLIFFDNSSHVCKPAVKQHTSHATQRNCLLYHHHNHHSSPPSHFTSAMYLKACISFHVSTFLFLPFLSHLLTCSLQADGFDSTRTRRRRLLPPSHHDEPHPNAGFSTSARPRM